MKILSEFIFFLPFMLPFLASCRGGNAYVQSETTQGDTITMTHAVNLTMVEHDGYTIASIRNPWDTTKTLHTYILVPRDSVVPPELPEGTLIRIPLERSVVYSSVHNSLVVELGADRAIKGICDVQYIHLPQLVNRIQSGDIADCGNSMSPDIERLISLQPDAILLSPFENSGGYGKLEQLGVPIVECADYMETSPLGRAEWMKFYGRLYGRTNEADSIFAETANAYNRIKEMASSPSVRPRVLMDRIFGQVWNVPGAYSTMGRFIEDAGGVNPFDSFKQSGSRALAPEEVLYTVSDADVWLVRYSGTMDMTRHQFGADNAIYPRFDAFKKGDVYGCNTQYVPFYEEVPFHPQWLLADMVSILHPDLAIQAPRSYFTRMK